MPDGMNERPGGGDMRKLIAGLGLAGAVLLAASPVERAAAQTPFDVHVVLALTGGGAFLGQAEQKALQLAEKVVNEGGGIKGTPIRFVFHDDQTSPQVSVQVMNEVLAAKPAVVLGSSLVATCSATGPLMQAGPVEYCFSPGIHPAAGSYVFTASVSTHDLAIALVRYFRAKGWKKIAIMTSTDASGQDAENNLKEVIGLPENKEMSIVENAHFNPGDVSVTAQIERVKAANPQAMIAWSTGAPVATVFRGIQQAGLDIPIGTTDGNMTYAQMNQFAAFLPKQLYIPSSQWVALENPKIQQDPAIVKAQQAYYKVFKDAGLQPEVSSELAWEPAMLVIEALRSLGTKATAEQIRNHIAHLKGYASVNGIYDFEKTPQRGLDINNAVVTLWNPQSKMWEPVSKPAGAPLD
jgi:branched-chain amino acid transport system substrate-binding protein